MPCCGQGKTPQVNKPRKRSKATEYVVIENGEEVIFHTAYEAKTYARVRGLPNPQVRVG